ncbi:MAG: rhomboid family intramembrane serine protease [Woeseia sp.]|nr:rhomboid family intramembrane serine protease [Woeseia sp.]MBT8096212.1 rhomboid family intramembrane serine protease [Woeseia sp.]
MLILPMERTFNIRRPPVVTFLLLIVNTIVFLSTSGSDDETLVTAVAAYEEQQILATELPLYGDYLAEDAAAPEHWRDIESVDVLGEYERFHLIVQLLVDDNYAQYLERNSGLFTFSELDALERKQEIVDTYIPRLIIYRFGFVPAEFSFLTLFSSQFLHGGWGHLIGNMVILLLIGLTVEQLLGSFNYTLFYLLSGAFGAIVYGLVHFGSPMPAVGASGAISGLMGMYVAAYGTRKIRFFYWIGFYFNYAKLPALMMLPVWVGKEVFDFFFTESNVGYTAHAGGLIAGAGLVLLGRSSFAKVDTEIIEYRDEEREYREDLEHALQLVDRADFQAAKQALTRLLERYPGDARALFQLVQLGKAKPGTKDYHLATYNYLNGVLASGSLSKDTLSVIRDYWKCAEPGPRIRGQLLSQILNKLIAVGELDLAEELCRSAETHGLLDPEALKEANAYRLNQTNSGGSRVQA